MTAAGDRVPNSEKVGTLVELAEAADSTSKNPSNITRFSNVEIIEKYYAAHIKTSLDAAAINVMRPKKKREARKRSRTLRLYRSLQMMMERID